MLRKEEYAVVLDYLPNGYPLEKKMMPVAQAIGVDNQTLLQLVPRRGISLEVGEKVYIGEGKREKIYYIMGKLHEDKITGSAKEQLEDYLENKITNNEKRFIDFFNTAEAINTRVHQFELLPGFGKKHTKAIIEERNKKPFESFEDLKKRVHNLPNPKKSVKEKLLNELLGKEKYCIFTNR